ncbi:MAG: inositol-phosphate phosphatase [Armatimonadetes bacterium]|nr:inositol-phosphate phosphatase [Armatimonadota bacterium]
MTDLQRATEVALEIAHEAGQLALACYGRAQVEEKHDGSLVTQADRGAEELIRSRLAAAFPDHAVFGEEFGIGGNQASPYVWYIDPVDGTSNFVHGLPLWGVSVGLTYAERSVAGAFVMPVMQETYWGWEGGGAWQDGRRVAVADRTEMRTNDFVSIASTILNGYQVDLPQKLRCLGSASHALAAVAAGHFVAAIQDNWKPYDFAAVLVMCQEAGVVVTYEDGRAFESFAGLDRSTPGPTLVAAGPGIHSRVLSGLRRR